jgi:hypothetical protein
MITTNSRAAEPIAPAEPKKLGIRTTAQLPTPEPEPITRGSDLSKMITTHGMDDERDVEDMRQDKPANVPKKKGR